MRHLLPRLMRALFAGLTVALVASAWAQARPAGQSLGSDSKVEIYGGYGFLDPVNADINNYKYPEIYNPNATASLSYYFSRHLGIQAEGSYFSKGRDVTSTGFCDVAGCSPVGQRVYTAEGGPVVRVAFGRWIPYAHVLGGGERMNGPAFQRLNWGWGVTGGMGVDYVFPFFNNLIAVRPIQADYQYSHVDNGPLVQPLGVTGGLGEASSVKLSGGLVLRFGGEHGPLDHPAMSLDCNVDPTTLNAGDPVQVSAHPVNFHSRRGLSYLWSATGGNVMPTESGATITTVGLPPGDYTVTGTVVEGKHRAECTEVFTVRSTQPPTLSCSANPKSVKSGEVATITSIAMSPANRSLTYSYSSDAGQINGTGATAQLATAGVSTGTINVTCNVVDDQGKTAQAKTSVAVRSSAIAPGPMAPPLADTQALCGVSFDRDRKRPVRVDNEAKACLDDIALTLQRDTDAKLVIVGNYGAGETSTQGAQRSLNVRQYLTDEKGIDVSRIEVRYGDQSGRSVDNVLLPAGVTYTNARTTVFDPTSVKRVGQAYGKHGVAIKVHPQYRHKHHHVVQPVKPVRHQSIQQAHHHVAAHAVHGKKHRHPSAGKSAPTAPPQ